MQNNGVTPSGSGLRPFGAEPQDASQAKPLVPNAAQAAEKAIAEALKPYNECFGRGSHANEWIARRCCDAAAEAVRVAIAAHLKQCIDATVNSRSDFNQGVTRGAEIAWAQVEYGHASGTLLRENTEECSRAKPSGPTGEAGDAQ